MRFLAIIVLGASLFTSCESKSPYLDPSGEISGKIIYQKKCFICHGENGDQGEAGAANLQTSMLSEEQMQTVVKKGKGNMQAFTELTEEEVKMVIQHIRTDLKKKNQ